MGIPLDDDAFDALFRDYRYTAWRLETRTAYGKVDEDEPYQQWLSGKDPGIGWFEPWLRMMREELAKGKRMERVRIIDDPPSDYLRWELWATPYNLGVGEDIRYLPREHPVVAELPDEDFWIFDSRLLARFEFDGPDVIGVHLDDDPRAVVTALAARDAAWHHALTYTEYMATRVG
ncbi:DUF6879 family protein [Marinactinospora thermotolerans]|uniref:DUF6879 domain-containing protein n=1 Tax=Marinactinospora thermotolerans DSM 45154 TaxID=1122192 RepID=A0A1T4TDH8_9ACTN|nr:DUF6879 family protein [Marinactinospora thermotolerans]SKA38467.1 hypothetical protein SAMN02745673_04834 [Marinactinospora thermotolerans DSM 45154]